MPSESDPGNHPSLCEKEIFLRALEIDDPKERFSWVSKACASDEDLYTNVRALLAAADTIDSPLEPDADLLSSGLREMADSATPLVGSSLTYFGDYELLDEIARGAMGIVFRARQSSLNRIVAVKMIRGAVFSSSSEVGRFKVEAEAAASLDHPNIVPIYEVGEHEDQHYFSMKFIEGGTLADHLARFGKDPRAAAQLLVIVARAIQEAHQHGILHRDLKPGNILLDDQGQPHITDFGLAKQLGTESGLTQSGQLMGTPFYMAPEQAAGDAGQLSTAADIYSLGAILFELLSGRPPFHGDSLLETLRMAREEEVSRLSTLAAIDRDLETIVTKCLQKTPAARYPSAGALADDLECWLEGKPIAARPIKSVERTLKWIKRKPVAASLIGVAALLLFTLGVGGPIVAYQQKKLTSRAEQSEVKTGHALSAVARAKDRLERENYRFSIQLAESRLGTDKAYTVPGLLWATNPELRSWEWGHLMAQCELEDWSVITGDGPVVKIEASPNGNFFVTISDHTVALWNTESKEKRWEKHYQEKLSDVACHPDGKYVAIVRMAPDANSLFPPKIAQTRSVVSILSGSSGERVHAFQPEYLPRVAFGQEGDSFYVVTLDAEATAKIPPVPKSINGQAHLVDGAPVYLHRYNCGEWDEPKLSGPAVQRFLQRSADRRLRIDRAGKWLGLTRNFGLFDVYDSQSLKHIRTIKFAETLGGRDIALDSESGRAITANHNRVLESSPLSRIDGGKPKEFHHKSKSITALALLPNERSHIATTPEALLVVRDGKLAKVIRHEAGITGMAPLNRGRNQVLIADKKGVVRCWNLDGVQRPAPRFSCLLGAQERQGQHVEIHPTTNRAIFRDHLRKELYETKFFPAGDQIHVPEHRQPLAVLGHISKGGPQMGNLLPIYAPDGNLILRGKNSLLILDHESNSPGDELVTPYPPFDAVFDRKGDWLVVSGEDGELAAIHRPSGKVVNAKFAAGGACRVDLSKDGTLAIAILPGQHIYAWSPATGECMFERPTDASSAAVHPDGTLIATGGNGIQLLDPSNGTTLRTMAPGYSFLNIRFSPDGLRIATSTGGFTLWDWQLGEALINFKTNASSRDLTFSRDGLTLAYSGMNPTLNVRFALPWQYDLGDPEFYQAVRKLFESK